MATLTDSQRIELARKMRADALEEFMLGEFTIAPTSSDEDQSIEEHVNLKEKSKFDPEDKSEKPPMHLCPVSLPEAVATVFGRGAHNRPSYDWLDEPRPYTRYMDSLERHVNKFKDGILYDDETGMHHLWHAAACLAILIEYEKREVGTNDIYEHKFERQGEPK